MAQKVILQSKDDQQFEVALDVAKQSGLVKNMLEDIGEASSLVIPLPEVRGVGLERFVKFATQHAEWVGANPRVEEDDDKTYLNKELKALEGWDDAFITILLPENEGAQIPTEAETTEQKPKFVSGLPEDKMDTEAVCELALAANYLECKSLLAVAGRTINKLMTQKTPEEIYQYFKMTVPWTKEEEEFVRDNTQWILDDIDK